MGVIIIRLFEIMRIYLRYVRMLNIFERFTSLCVRLPLTGLNIDSED
jgi:hypothetical protein